MAISSNTLFHVTNSLEKLYNILREQAFRVHYCRETFSSDIILEEITDYESKGTMGGYIPMVSFCDIPLSDIKPHFEKYQGVCAIGMSKEWGQTKGLNPVLYTQKDSILTKYLIEFWQSNFDNFSTHFDKNPDNLYRLFRYIISHTKNYKGVIRDGKIEIDNIPYDEKEWRYIPTDKQLLEVGITHDLLDKLDTIGENKKTIEEIFNTKNDIYITDQVQKIKLRFEAKDIKYIIVEDKKNIKKMVNFLNDKFKEDAPELIAGIFTKNQIFKELS